MENSQNKKASSGKNKKVVNLLDSLDVTDLKFG